MAKATAVEQTRVVPCNQQGTFDATLAMPLPITAGRRYGPIAPIVRVDGQTGDWDAVGQSRTLVLSDGGTLRETLQKLDSPASFSYTLSNFTGPLALLVTRIDGEFSFAPEDVGTRIIWRYTMHPRTVLSRPVLPIFGRLWQGYAKQILEELAKLLPA
jgi:hypothetical protein